MAEWNTKANDIFLRAVEIDSPTDRCLFVEQQCYGDDALRAQVESLLVAGGKVGSFLELPALAARYGETAAHRRVTEEPGTIIGPYKLLQRIGEGGFGAVYMAEQEQPVRRKVALKIIKPGMDTREVIARFESERQALAMMEHPNIARVFDAGATDSGRPYFVMELVRGVPITEFCDRNRLPAEQRLKLFITVCQAIQHAHHKGIIHRDVKPSNVMITLHDGVPVVKVIDFGVAKATAQKLTEKTLFTAYGQMVGTPAYMSPEQAEMSGLDIDTRSDIFSLGVLLYELLTGTTPLDSKQLRQAGYAEMQRLIREEEAPRPSTRFSSLGGEATVLASNSGTDARRLAQLLRSDLDWIVMKALEKDRNRRYGSPANFAADVERFLAELPVEARPPSAWYRFTKLARRNMAALTTAAAVALALVLGMAVSVWQAVRAWNAEATARAEGAAKEEARLNEASQRALAEERKQATEQALADAQAAQSALRRSLYYSNLPLIQSAWEANNFSLVKNLLTATRPKAGEPDLRGFEWYYWDRQCHAEIVPPASLGIHDTSGTYRAALTPDGTRYAVAVTDPDMKESVVKVWGLPEGRELWTVPVGAGQIASVNWSGDGQRLAIFVHPTGVDLMPRTFELTELLPVGIQLWDVASRKRLVTFTGFQSRFGLPTISRDGSRVAVISHLRRLGGAGGQPKLPPKLAPKTGMADGGLQLQVEVQVWDMGHGSEPQFTVSFLQFGNGPLLSNTVFSPDGGSLAGMTRADSGKEAVEVRDLATGTTLATYLGPATQPEEGFEQIVLSTVLDFSPDGKRLAVVWSQGEGPTHTVCEGVVYDAAGGKPVAAFRPVSGLGRLAYSPDGKRLVWWQLWSQNPVGEVWDADTGNLVRTLKGQVARVTDVAFNGDGTRVVSADATGSVKQWDATPTPMPKAVPIDVRKDRDRTADGRRELVCTPEGISVRDATGRELRLFKEHQKEVDYAQFSPDGRYVVSGFWKTAAESEQMVWEADTGRVLLAQKLVLSNYQFSANGRWLVAAVEMGGAKASYQFSADGRRLVAALEGGGAKVWDLPEFREVFRCDGDALAVDFSPDGRRVTTAPYPGLLAPQLTGEWPETTIWDVETGKKLFTTKRPPVWSADGKLAVTASPSDDRDWLNIAFDVQVFDAGTGAEVLKARVRPEFSGRTWTPAFSPDAKYLAIPEGGGEVALWDVGAKKEMHRLKGHQDAVWSLAFTPDGRRLATICAKMEVRIWDVTAGVALLTVQYPHERKVNSKLAFSPDGHQLLMTGPFAMEVLCDATPRRLEWLSR